MSKYFTEVEFVLPEDPGENARPKPKMTFDVDKIKEAAGKIQAAFEEIRSGSSDLTSYPIDPGNFSFPTGNRLSMLIKDPTEVNYIGFLEIAKQDLGLKAATQFMEWLKDAKEKNDE